LNWLDRIQIRSNPTSIQNYSNMMYRSLNIDFWLESEKNYLHKIFSTIDENTMYTTKLKRIYHIKIDTCIKSASYYLVEMDPKYKRVIDSLIKIKLIDIAIWYIISTYVCQLSKLKDSRHFVLIFIFMTNCEILLKYLL